MSYPRTNTVTRVDQHVAGVNTTTHASITDRRWRLRKVLASFSTSTQVGTITIAGLAGPGGTTVSIVRDFVGAVDLDFGPDGLQSATGADLVVTMTAGAASVTGNLTTIAFPE